MTKPTITPFSQIGELFVQKYERYLPTAFDESMTLLQKMNKIIEYLNQIGKLTNDVVTQWNTVMEWVMNDGLTDAVSDKLDEMVADGTLDNIINEVLFGELNDKIESNGINIKYPPFPLVGAKVDGVTDDTTQVRAILQYAEQQKMKVIIPGISVITDEVEIKQPLIIEGIGSGEGYGDEALTKYKQMSGFLVKGTGIKRVRTRRNHRASALDPQDNPLSVALNVQSGNVKLRDFTIFLDFNKADNSPTNYGANFDIGLFVGSRTHFQAENVHVLGYWRQASMYFDVTHATNLPRFNDVNELPYQNDFNISGGDGCYLQKVFTKGGKWGIFVAGAIRHASNPNYFDETMGEVPDQRGSFGFSDFTTLACSIYGTDHHSNYRRHYASGNYLTDIAGGAMYIDGYGSAVGTVQGMRFISTRFATFEPFRVRLDRVNRPMFIGCHVENRSSTSRKNPDGTTVDFNTQNYGLITATENTNRIYLEGISGKVDRAYIPSTVPFTNIAPTGDSQGFGTTEWFTGESVIQTPRLQAINGELDVRSTTGFPIRFREGTVTRALLNDSGFSADVFKAMNGDLDIRSASETDLIRIRRGNTSVVTIGDVMTVNYPIVPNVDDTLDIGSASARYKAVYSNGIRMKDSATGTDYLVRVTNGVLTLTAM